MLTFLPHLINCGQACRLPNTQIGKILMFSPLDSMSKFSRQEGKHFLLSLHYLMIVLSSLDMHDRVLKKQILQEWWKSERDLFM